MGWRASLIKLRGGRRASAAMFVDIRDVSYDGSIQRVGDGTHSLTLPVFDQFRLVATDRLRVTLQSKMGPSDCALQGIVYRKDDDAIYISCGGHAFARERWARAGRSAVSFVSKVRRRKREGQTPRRKHASRRAMASDA